MAERIDPADKARLIDAVDLVALIAEDHAVTRDGAHHAVCCPWHVEDTPSCIIYDDQHFHCFGCGAHGDALTYLQEQRGLSWDDALAEMRRRAGPGFEPTPAKVPKKSKAKPGERQDRTVWTPVMPVPEKAPQRPPSHRHYGDPERLDAYRDAAGQLVGYVARYASASHGKVTPVWTWCEGMQDGVRTEMWRQRRWERPYPLMGADSIAARPAASILIVEGEKTAAWCADHLTDYVAVTSCGGHQNWKHSDWSEVRGRKVYLWADADLDHGKGPAAWRSLALFLAEDLGATVHMVAMNDIAKLLGSDHYPDDWDELCAQESAAAKAEKRKVDMAPLAAARGLDLPPDGWDLADADTDDATLAKIRHILIHTAPMVLPHQQAPITPDIDIPLPGAAAANLAALTSGEEEDRQAALDQELAQLPLTESDLAARLVRRYGDSFRFDATSERWYVWAGSHWRVDIDGQMKRWALASVAALHREAKHCPAYIQAKDYHARARECHKRKIRDGMIADARMFIGVTIPDRSCFDSDDWLLATPCGTLDLRTMTIRKPRREDLITVCTRAEWHGIDVRHPMLDRVLQQLTGGEDEFLLTLSQVFGSALVGGNRHKRFYLMTGVSDTGKSTLIAGIQSALGQAVCLAAGMDTFTASKQEKIRSDIARLNGPRLIYSDDTRDGIMLDDGIIKIMTGGTEIVARFLHANEFQFKARFTPVLIMNDEPVIRASDAIRNRLVRIHFSHALRPEEKDYRVLQTMEDYRQVGPAILAWLARGCRQHIERDGALPDHYWNLAAATLSAGDSLESFLDDWLDWRPTGWCIAKDIRTSYENDYCNPDGLTPVSGQCLNRHLRQRGAVQRVDRVDGKCVKCWSGVTLRSFPQYRQVTHEVLPVTDVTENLETIRITPEMLTARARAVSNSSPCITDIEKSVTSVTGNDQPYEHRIDDEPPF